MLPSKPQTLRRLQSFGRRNARAALVVLLLLLIGVMIIITRQTDTTTTIETPPPSYARLDHYEAIRLDPLPRNIIKPFSYKEEHETPQPPPLCQPNCPHMHRTKPTGKLDMDAVQTRMEEEVHRLLVEGGYDGTHRHRTRLVTMSNRFDEVYCTLQGSAALSGVRLTSLGYKEEYNFMRRLRAVVDYAAAEGLDDEDVILWVDSDTVLTGRDMAAAVADYVLHSAPSEAQLDVAAVRAWEDYGPAEAGAVLRSMTSRAEGQQQWQYPPVLYNAENGCFLAEYINVICRNFTNTIEAMIKVARDDLKPGEEYTMSELWNKTRQYATLKEENLRLRPDVVDQIRRDIHMNARYFSNLRRDKIQQYKRNLTRSSTMSVSVYSVSPDGMRNDRGLSHAIPIIGTADAPPRSFNAGAYIGRVWALKKLTDVFELAVREVQCRKWYCFFGATFTNDQAVLGMLYYTQRLWEVEYGLLEAPPPAAEERRTMTPFDIPVGLMGLDKRRSFFGIDVAGLNPHTRRYVFLPSYTKFLRKSRSGALLAVYRNELLLPLSWHFAGGNKTLRSEEAQFSYSWMMSSFLNDDVYRHNSYILSQYTIELISGKERYYGDFMTICGNPLIKGRTNNRR
ncbi:hypothetical protein, conserved [Angomonas deanei]|uniref:Uncharacterized protein n=1 Tax=Angomonas deanei TaxID=59799 RepID=A0A7G2CRV0_9TRYP|nr:hypothetical protein, conserved [Angomonas deanei]